MKKFIRVFVIPVVLISVYMLFGLSTDTYAVGASGAGGTGGGSGGGCSIGGCAGGGWFYFDWPDQGAEKPTVNDAGITYGGDASSGWDFPSGTVSSRCADVGGYYVSSWYHYLHGEEYRGLIGVAQNSIWNVGPGTGGAVYGHPKNGAPEPVPIAEVQADFEEAKKYDESHKSSNGYVPIIGDGVDWGNIGWFCWQNKRMNKKSRHLLRKLYNNTITFFTPAFSIKILWIMDKTGKIS